MRRRRTRRPRQIDKARGICRPSVKCRGDTGARKRAAGLRALAPGGVQASEVGRVRGGAAENRDGEDSAVQTARIGIAAVIVVRSAATLRSNNPRTDSRSLQSSQDLVD